MRAAAAQLLTVKKSVKGNRQGSLSRSITRRSVTLEPMNAYERHVIHAALQDVKGVTTYSVGAEPNRRVVVAFDRGEAR